MGLCINDMVSICIDLLSLLQLDMGIATKSHIGGGAKLDKDDRHTTLTIVQDFPKKKPDQN
jgi:hypothetical protein